MPKNRAPEAIRRRLRSSSFTILYRASWFPLFSLRLANLFAQVEFCRVPIQAKKRAVHFQKPAGFILPHRGLGDLLLGGAI